MYKLETNKFYLEIYFTKPDVSQLFQIRFKHGSAKNYNKQKCLIIKTTSKEAKWSFTGKKPFPHQVTQHLIAIIDDKLVWITNNNDGWCTPEVISFCEKIFKLDAFS